MGWGWGLGVKGAKISCREDRLNRWRIPLDCAIVYVGRSHSFTAYVDFIVDTVHSQRNERAKRHFHADHITSKALDPWLARVVCYTFAKHMLHADFGTCFGATHESVRLLVKVVVLDTFNFSWATSSGSEFFF